MKRNLTLICAGVLMSVLCAGFNESSAQTSAKTIGWDYPVKPGTPEWANFKTKKEKIDACQIPQDILNSITTKGLVKVCLDYPLYGDIFAYNSMQEGFREVATSFNGIQELFRRDDRAQCLLDVLRSNDLFRLQARKNISTTLQIGETILRHSFLEVMLSHESVIVNASDEQQKEIIGITTKNLIIKESEPEFYSSQGLESSAYLLGTIMKTGNGKVALSPDLERFLKQGTTHDVTMLIEELVNNSAKF
jgi:hypothetical protein